MANSYVGNWQQAFLLATSNIITNVLSFIQTLIAALVVFLVGLILARWAKVLTVKLFETLSLSSVVKKSGFDQFLKKAEIKIKIEEILGGIVKWIIILIFFVTTINILGLTTVSLVLNNILNYIPRIISAVLVDVLVSFLEL